MIDRNVNENGRNVNENGSETQSANVTVRERQSVNENVKRNVSARGRLNVSARETSSGARRRRESARPRSRSWRTYAANSNHKSASWPPLQPKSRVETPKRAPQHADHPLHRPGDALRPDLCPRPHHRCAKRSTRSHIAVGPAALTPGQIWTR